MKNIYDILKEAGLEVPEDKKAEFDKAWKENYKAVADYNKVVEKRDELQTSLNGVQEELGKFKDVNVDDLQKQVGDLTKKLEDQAKDYEKKEADRLFNESITEAIKQAGGKNAKSILALMDVDRLRESKNQSEDIKAAIEAVKQSDDYMFGSEEPIKNATGGTGSNGGSGGTEAGLTASLRAAMGLPTEK